MLLRNAFHFLNSLIEIGAELHDLMHFISSETRLCLDLFHIADGQQNWQLGLRTSISLCDLTHMHNTNVHTHMLTRCFWALGGTAVSVS